jgi:hypothetical protein
MRPEIAQRNQQIVALRRNGVSSREIAERYDMKTTSVRTILSDPDGSKMRARKERYRGTCRRCGGPTSGGDGRAKAPTICVSCFNIELHENRHWTQERIIDAIKRFAAEHGRPPVAPEWLYGSHGKNGDGYPYATTVLNEFGSWANAIEAAGFPRPRIGGYERTPETLAKMRVPRVPAETYIQRISDASVDGWAPSSHDLRFVARQLRKRYGINWSEACHLAGVRPRLRGNWRKERYANGAQR